MKASDTFSVLTWNLWWRFGPWEERLPAIVETLRRADADILTLQEVWVAGDDSAAHRIGDALGMHVVVRNRLEFDGVGFGNAVVSRWPITDVVTLDLPGHPTRGDEERLVVGVDIDAPFGPVQAYSTHLNWRHDHSAVRQEQVAALCRFVDGRAPRLFPAVVGGDFNAEPDSHEIRMLTGLAPPPVDGLVFVDTFRAAGRGDGLTWSNSNAFAAAEFEFDRRIDYVFSTWRKPDGRGQPVASAVVGDSAVNGVWPSDHFGVQTWFRATPAGQSYEAAVAG